MDYVNVLCWRCKQVVVVTEEEYDPDVNFICVECSQELEDQMNDTVDNMIDSYKE